jgi:dihydroorotate dehydrogenase electron transfer subunit
MKLLNARVKKIEKIKHDVFLLSFHCPAIAKIAQPGQFLHIKVRGPTILRRPLSIHSVKGNDIYLLFRVRGRGTLALSRYKSGDELDILGPLGQGFTIRPTAHGPRPTASILVAGGMGAAPLVFLAVQLKKQSMVHGPRSTGKKPKNIVLLGAKTKSELLCEKEFKKLGFEVKIATEDGSLGTQGTVVDVLNNYLSTFYSLLSTFVYACGPNAMLFEISKILEKHPQTTGQVSFEQFMGCGIGICCGCTINTKNGFKKACKDGPVFDIRDVW